MLAGVLLQGIRDDENGVNYIRVHESTAKCDIRELLCCYLFSFPDIIVRLLLPKKLFSFCFILF